MATAKDQIWEAHRLYEADRPGSGRPTYKLQAANAREEGLRALLAELMVDPQDQAVAMRRHGLAAPVALATPGLRA